MFFHYGLFRLKKLNKIKRDLSFVILILKIKRIYMYIFLRYVKTVLIFLI